MNRLHAIVLVFGLLSLSSWAAEKKVTPQEIRQSVFEKTITFVKSINGSSPGYQKDRIIDLLDESSKNPEIYNAVCDAADEILADPESILRNEDMLITFLQYEIDSPVTKEAQRERARYRLETALKNRPGSLAPDFTFIDRNGTEKKLRSLPFHDKNILIFYDPDCNHCLEAMKTLSGHVLPDSVQVIAIDAEEDQDLWDSTKHSLPEKWIVGFSTDPIQDDETYVLQMTPTIFLLDGNHKILLKDATVEQLLDSIAK